MHQVRFLQTTTNGQQEVCIITLDNDSLEVVGNESFADLLFVDIDRNNLDAVISKMRSAPNVFTGGYLRALYEYGVENGS